LSLKAPVAIPHAIKEGSNVDMILEL